MELLVTTLTGLWRVTESGYSQIMEDNFYGLTWDEERVYVHSSKTSEITLTDKSFKNRETVKIPQNRSVHQILYVPKLKRIIATNSKSNELVLLKRTKKSVVVGKRYNYGTPKVDNHFNSIYQEEGNYWLLHHNQKHSPPVVVRLDRKFRTKKFFNISTESLAQAHNLFRIDNKIVTLMAKGGQIAVIDLRTKKVQQVNIIEEISAELYLRGLAVTKDRFYVGASPAVPRHLRATVIESYIYEFDRGWNVVKVRTYEGLTEIHDIRAIHTLDLAHNSLNFR